MLFNDAILVPFAIDARPAVYRWAFLSGLPRPGLLTYRAWTSGRIERSSRYDAMHPGDQECRDAYCWVRYFRVYAARRVSYQEQQAHQQADFASALFQVRFSGEGVWSLRKMGNISASPSSSYRPGLVYFVGCASSA